MDGQCIFSLIMSDTYNVVCVMKISMNVLQGVTNAPLFTGVSTPLGLMNANVLLVSEIMAWNVLVRMHFTVRPQLIFFKSRFRIILKRFFHDKEI